MSFDADLDALSHEHDFLHAAHDANARRTLWVVVLTAAMMVAEIAAGLMFNSMALLADGFHMATHAGALGVAALAYAYAKKHAKSGKYSFGTGKVGDLAGFASALLLGLVALGIAWESAQRLIDPQSVAFQQATWIAVLGLLVNLVSAALLSGGQGHHGHADHGHHHPHGHSHHGHDNNIRSAYIHVLADALTSVLAILALLGGQYLGWMWLDPVIGMIGAVVIAIWALSLMRETARILLDAHAHQLEAEVRQRIDRAGQGRITDVHIWRVGPGAHAAIISVTGLSADVVRQQLRAMPEIAHLTVEEHPQPVTQVKAKTA